MEKLKRKCLKQLQGLPDNTSSSACLALLGIIPIEATLHKNLLNIFVNMIKLDNSVELELAHRQLVMKDNPRESIFTHIKSILEHDGLPSVFSLFAVPHLRLSAKYTIWLNQHGK